jgi:anaerobic dimethyl sulfoxide reductase subunit A
VSERLPVACNRDCGGGCPLVATVADGRVVRIADNPAGGPFLKGCVRGFNAMRQLYADGRLTMPLIRTGARGSGQFREAGWDEAIAFVADGLQAVRDKHGDGAILALGGSGSCRGALHNTGELTARFLNLVGGHVGESNSYSSAAAKYAERVLLGTRDSGIDAATLQQSEMIILWGANIFECIMGCEMRARVRQAKERGVPVVVIDPRNTETAKRLGTEWLPVLPGTDSALMLAVLYVLITEKLVDEAFVAAHATGFEELRRRVLGTGGSAATESSALSPDAPSALPPGQAATPAWAEGVCGTPAARIVALAREYARRWPAALIPGLSIQRTLGGEEAVRLAIALQVATGNFGRRGGSSGGQTWSGLPEPDVGCIDTLSHPASTQIPANDWADAVLGGRAAGYPADIHAAYNVGGNYVAQAADVAKSVRAMQALDFSVCHELFMTSTARQCDVVLPVTHWLERQDIVFTCANHMLFSHKVAEPLTGTRNDFDIFADIAARMGLGDEFTEGRDEDAWLRHLVAGSPIADYDEFRRVGVWFGKDQERVAFEDFAADPGAHPLTTPSGRIELCGDACSAARLTSTPDPRIMPHDDARPLRLITPKSRFRVHSQLDDLPWFAERDERALLINPRDAAARGVGDGAPVVISSAQGVVRCACRVTDDIMPGVVSLCEGIDPKFNAAGEDVAGAANVLTSDAPTLPSRGARMHSTSVEVRRG